MSSPTTDPKAHPVPPSKAKFDKWLLIVCAAIILAGLYGTFFAS